jgi:hypothetical protein
MTHPTADYIARIQRREHERHHSALFKLVGPGLPELPFTEHLKVFGDVIEFHNCEGMDYFVPVHQIRFITHKTPEPNNDVETGWTVYI